MSTFGDIAGSVVGGLLGAVGSDKAADASRDGAMAGVAENRRQFDTTLNLQAPAINTGNVARSTLASILGLTVPGSTYTAGGTGGSTGGATGQQYVVVGGRKVPVRGDAVASTGAGGVTFNNPGSAPISGDGLQQMLEQFPGYKFAVDQATKSAQALGSATGSLGGNVVSGLAERVGGGIALPVFNSYLDRLEGLSGGGSNASNAASVAALNTGNNVAAGLNNAGDARASGILGQTSSIGGILGGLGKAYENSRTTTPGSSNGIPYYLARP